MILIKKYHSEDKLAWDEFLSKTKNATFLFYRDYMDYHSDRFTDHSFIIYRKGKIEAVLPGNVAGNKYYSHQGLTYGGLIYSSKLGTKDVLDIFQALVAELKKAGITEIIYKPVPHIYHTMPASEDIYALFRLQAVKIGCNISTALFQNNKPKFIESRKSGIRKSIKEGVTFQESDDFESFWEILNNNLENKFGAYAVHSVGEIKQLKSKFPENIKLYVAFKDRAMVAGVIVYAMAHIAHVQYISANAQGRETGALDFIFDELVNKIYADVNVFDFGSSTEQMGNSLNENLIFQKEGFGGRGVCYEIYKINIG